MCSKKNKENRLKNKDNIFKFRPTVSQTESNVGIWNFLILGFNI